MKVHKVYARKNAIWAFTVVGRPPQEDTSFGQLIHSMTGSAVSNEIKNLDHQPYTKTLSVLPLRSTMADGDAKVQLLSRLKAINEEGWIKSKQKELLKSLGQKG